MEKEVLAKKKIVITVTEYTDGSDKVDIDSRAFSFYERLGLLEIVLSAQKRDILQDWTPCDKEENNSVPNLSQQGEQC